MEYATLYTGEKMPMVGYGTYKIADNAIACNCVTSALAAGYRLIDTATFYKNEEGIGNALRSCGILRKDLFITTKIWTDVNTRDKVRRTVESSLSMLKTDYLDLLLIHWPTSANVEVWHAMEELQQEGVLKGIGTSNFKEHHIDELLEESDTVPVVNQVEFHPLFQQNDLREYCAAHDIILQAWSPLMRGKAFDIPEIPSIAEKYGVSTAQLVLRWDVQSGVATVPKTENEGRMTENLDVFGFKISDDDMKILASLNRDERHYRDPDCHGY